MSITKAQIQHIDLLATNVAKSALALVSGAIKVKDDPEAIILLSAEHEENLEAYQNYFQILLEQAEE